MKSPSIVVNLVVLFWVSTHQQIISQNSPSMARIVCLLFMTYGENRKKA